MASKSDEVDHINSGGEEPTQEQATTGSPTSMEWHCRYCTTSIPRKAKVCPKCSRDQRWYLNYFRIDHVGLIIALLMITISYQQLQEVRRERVAATQALSRAQEAETKAATVTKNLAEIQATVERQGQDIGLLAEKAKQSFAEIEAAQRLSLQAISQLEEARGLLRKAEISVDQLRSSVDFNLLLNRARNDDREAFDRIVNLSKEKGPFQKIAFDAASQIVTEIDPLVSLRVNPKVPWELYSLDPKRDEMAKLLKMYSSMLPIHKPSYISEIWSQERFLKQKRMDFLYEIIKSDGSLRAVHRACVLMNMEANINKNLLGTKEYLQWWQANRSKYDERN